MNKHKDKYINNNTSLIFIYLKQKHNLKCMFLSWFWVNGLHLTIWLLYQNNKFGLKLRSGLRNQTCKFYHGIAYWLVCSFYMTTLCLNTFMELIWCLERNAGAFFKELIWKIYCKLNCIFNCPLPAPNYARPCKQFLKRHINT